MKPDLAMTTNVANFLSIFDALSKQPPGEPRMGVAYGYTGLGKTKAVIIATNRHNAVYLTANPTWSPRDLLEGLVISLGGVATHRLSKMTSQIIERLKYTGRTVILDEADSIFDNPKLVESFRALHDAGGCSSFVLVGMEHVYRKLARYPQLERRVSVKAEFLPLDFGDTCKVLDARCEIALSDDLKIALHEATQGHLARICLWINKAEQVWGKKKGAMSLEDWGDRPFVN